MRQVHSSLKSVYPECFNQIETNFRSLIHTIAPLIAKGIPSLKDLQKHLGRCFRELKPQLSIAESFDVVMELIEEKCTIINIACLESIVDRFNITKAKQCISEYKKEVDIFCHEVRLNVCEKLSFLKSSSSILKCDTTEFVLKWKPDKSTLCDIKNLLTKGFKDMANEVLVNEVRVITDDDSIIVTCYASRHIMDVLIMEAKTNLDVLIKMGLMKLTSGHHTIWNGQARDEVRQE